MTLLLIHTVIISCYSYTELYICVQASPVPVAIVGVRLIDVHHRVARYSVGKVVRVYALRAVKVTCCGMSWYVC